MERISVLTDLRTGAVDLVVRINLLREGLDLPEVAFIASSTRTKRATSAHTDHSSRSSDAPRATSRDTW